MLIDVLEKYSIEYRPIVAGNFVKNPIIKFFNYEIHDKLDNSDYLDKFGLFVGNHHYDLSEEFSILLKALGEV